MFNDIILESEGNVIIALLDCMYKESMMVRNGFDSELFMEADTASNGKKWYQKLWDGITAAWNWIKKSFEQLKNKIFKKDNGKIPEDKFKALMEEYKTGKYPRVHLDANGDNIVYMHEDMIFAMTYIYRAIMLFDNIIKQCIDQLNSNKPLTVSQADLNKLNSHMSEFDKRMTNMKSSKSSNMEPCRVENILLKTESNQAIININKNLSKIKTALGENVSSDQTTQELLKISKRVMKSFGNINAYILKAIELSQKQYDELKENAWNPKSDKESTDQKANEDPKQLETKETTKDDKSQDQTTTPQPEQQTSSEQPVTQPDPQQQNTQQPEPTLQQQSPQPTQQPQRSLFDFGPIKNVIASAKRSHNFIDRYGRQTSDSTQAPFAFIPVKNNTIFQIYPNLEYFTNLENGTESGKRLQQLRLYFNLIDLAGNPIDFTSNNPHVVAQFKPATRLPAGSRLNKSAYNKNGIIVFK